MTLSPVVVAAVFVVVVRCNDLLVRESTSCVHR